jgi:hypothetical protein
MSHRAVLVSATLVAGAIAVALILRPSHTIQPELAAPPDIPPALRAILKQRMERHGGQMSDLVSRLVILDYDGAARVAGAIYDEPTIARPLEPDQLNQLLPERFFVLQDALKSQTRRVVTAAAQKDGQKLAEELGVLVRACVQCHAAYLYERPAPRTAAPAAHATEAPP